MPKRSSILWLCCVPFVLMLTTAGLDCSAMVRNVDASIAPVSGAEFVAGIVSDPANEDGDKPNFEASTMPITTDDKAIMIV